MRRGENHLQTGQQQQKSWVKKPSWQKIKSWAKKIQTQNPKNPNWQTTNKKGGYKQIQTDQQQKN